MGNGLSDAFFPDNPKRRARANELDDQLRNLKARYDELKREHDGALDKAKNKLNLIFAALHISSLDDLDRRIQETVKGPVLEHWRQTSSTLDKLDKAEGIIYGITGIGALFGAAVVGVGAFFGAFTLAAGGAVLGTVLAIIGAITIIFSIIDGAIQRSKLRDSIRQLFKLRLQAHYAVGQLRIISRNLTIMVAAFDTFAATQGPKSAAEFVAHWEVTRQTLVRDMDEWTYEVAAAQLQQQDRSSKSWTSEDPSYNEIIKQLRTKKAIIVNEMLVSDEDDGDILGQQFFDEQPMAAVKLLMANGKCLAQGATGLTLLDVATADPDLSKCIIGLLSQDERLSATVVLHFGGRNVTVRDGQLALAPEGSPEPVQFVLEGLENAGDQQFRLRHAESGLYVSAIDGHPTADNANSLLQSHPWQNLSVSARWPNPRRTENPNPFDGGNWNAGAPPNPVQWIEVDFGIPRLTTGISLVVDQIPDGLTRHVITGGTIPNPSEVLVVLDEFTKHWQTLSAEWPAAHVQYLRVTTTSSPTWVAWDRITVS
eukprot:TRINITY_DN2264_c0_g1_i1.p1 TRINITY_DN2264_c0_g1~~TRINITY_DN2264_c0_g1_i1.p1  ORF type:complete len:576 (+),score=141.10 TRINITY_DN2264_c0_g1_i1:111-1730(+)